MGGKQPESSEQGGKQKEGPSLFSSFGDDGGRGGGGDYANEGERGDDWMEEEEGKERWFFLADSHHGIICRQLCQSNQGQ